MKMQTIIFMITMMTMTMEMMMKKILSLPAQYCHCYSTTRPSGVSPYKVTRGVLVKTIIMMITMMTMMMTMDMEMMMMTMAMEMMVMTILSLLAFLFNNPAHWRLSL